MKDDNPALLIYENLHQGPKRSLPSKIVLNTKGKCHL